MLMSYILSYLQIPPVLASTCKQKMHITAQFKLDIYTRVTREFLDKFLMSLVSFMQGNH